MSPRKAATADSQALRGTCADLLLPRLDPDLAAEDGKGEERHELHISQPARHKTGMELLMFKSFPLSFPSVSFVLDLFSLIFDEINFLSHSLSVSIVF